MSIEVKHLTYTYSAGTAYEVRALDDVSLTIPEGQFIGFAGHTGSGKSTLVQHLNGLVKPTSGQILYNGEDIHGEGFSLTKLRSKVGLVFQYPEHQLFEENVLADVCYGPKNLGLSQSDAERKAKEALAMLKIPESYYLMSPFELSGGEKRRVAIAGVLAMEPEVLILDEPTAGLDPMGRDELLALLKKLHEERHFSIILVSHSMEDLSNFADRVVVLDHGKIQFDGTPDEVFSHDLELKKIGLAVPAVTEIMNRLKENGFAIDRTVTKVDEAADILAEILGGTGAGNQEKASGKEEQR